ncbi:sensor histidine kinase [Clostridium botulinum]|uniref:sensor histidine kinase n=1 Tax=Clostridium botulinum TaxID=1491 RepID=UPI001E4E9A50|nr:ATP-binding protein [Clostridium botulinum]MCD3275822.1 GHKL domain-containing protein [Clostridium botulinum C/D]MCD3289117.1 GHKL domain-containing protein [Clostridium botulinum C/D]MCD3290113.1 GHKL domain-containing protein [Clostridium botulinum C/D]MCD3303412.1 GHKL domain-containing protein [Clostridium botulinum C/D]
MNIVEDSIVSILELILIMYLWNKFCLRDKSSIYKNIVILVLSSGVISVCIYMNLNVIFSYLIIIFIGSITYEKNIFKTILEFCIFLAMDMMLQLIDVCILTNLIGIKYKANFNQNASIVLFNLTFVVALYNLVLKNKRIYVKHINKRLIGCFIVNYGLYITISKLIWEYDKNIILRHVFSYATILTVIFLIQVYLYRYIIKVTEYKKELEVRNKYLPIIESITEDIRTRQHDFKNYINTINGFIQICSKDELMDRLKEYIGNLNSSNKDIEDIMYINNTVVKAIIYSKVREAQKYNIDFSYNIENNFLEDILKDYEISNILNNILNNAFEVVREQENNRIVILNILCENNNNIIEIRNNGKHIESNDFYNIFKKGFSTKSGTKRGYGLYNVKKIVDLNKGKIQLFSENNFTIFKILF